MTWREAARGIEPWKPAKLRWLGKAPLPPGVTLYYGIADLSAADLLDCVIDLADPDVRAAFDRRLALRLGAPPEAVEEGVLFYRYHTPEWTVHAGIIDAFHMGVPRWYVNVKADTDDPLLARCLAWKGVKT